RHTRFSRDWSSDVCSSDLSPAVRSHGIAPSVQEALLAGRHADAFGVLGPHRLDDRTVLRVLMPCALSVDAVFEDGAELALPPVEIGRASWRGRGELGVAGA